MSWGVTADSFGLSMRGFSKYGHGSKIGVYHTLKSGNIKLFNFAEITLAALEVWNHIQNTSFSS
jgi:hypothetical protein